MVSWVCQIVAEAICNYFVYEIKRKEPKMRRTFKREVRDYVIVERYKRKPWKQIVSEVKEKFDIEPPSIRIMQGWFRAYRTTTDDPTGAKFIATAIEDAASRAKPLAYAKMITEVMPLWRKLQKGHELTVEDAGWVSLWSFFEAQLGRENFDRTLAHYLRLRDKLSSDQEAGGK
jgi:hypothetical protein